MRPEKKGYAPGFTKRAEGRGLNPARLLGCVRQNGNPALRGGFSWDRDGEVLRGDEGVGAGDRVVQALVGAAHVAGVEFACVQEVEMDRFDGTAPAGVYAGHVLAVPFIRRSRDV